MEKIIVILGPTASGKSSLGIKLAKKFRGEIVSADSRQVYKGMDIGTGKVTRKEQGTVPHHLLDVASPKSMFTVAKFKKLAKSAVRKISKAGKLPFIVGGTAFYIYSLIDDIELPEAKPNSALRKELGKKTASELFSILKKMDPSRAASIDPNNRPRLIRAIEINSITGKPVPEFKSSPAYDSLIIGIDKPREELYRMIGKRLSARLKQGMINETKKLIKQGVSHKKLESFGLEYRYLSKFIKGELSKDKMLTELNNAIRKFSKRQMTWFKRDKRIHWVKTGLQAEKLIRDFLK